MNYIASELIQATKARDSERLRALLLTGADPDQRDEQGETALNWAAHMGHTSIVKDLLAAGASLELRGRRFEASALQLAASGMYRGIVSLLGVRSDVDARDGKGASALIRAFDHAGQEKAARKINDVVRTLLQAGADPDIQDSAGSTALMIAACHGYMTVVQSLLEAGADVTLKNHREETAQDVALKCGQLGIAGQLGLPGVG